ncbi:MAG: GNAT family N-acetyltransferase [Ardenticatenia bacterium]|nr:GNAT family N-acetyltransferase [Ardenticatenia bacterium]
MIATLPAMTLPLPKLDALWAHIVGSDPAHMRQGHLRVVSRDGDHIHVFLTPDGGVVAVPPMYESLVHGVAPEALMAPRWWSRALSVSLDHLAWYGPTAIWYATSSTFTPVPHPFARRLRRRDTAELARFVRLLRAREPETLHYWAIGGREIGQVRLWGAYYEGRLVAVVGERAWGRAIHEIGVNVLPRWRGMGIGTGVVSLATHEIVNSGALAQWTCPLDNRAAMRIAVRLGYRSYAHHFWLRVVEEPLS